MKRAPRLTFAAVSAPDVPAIERFHNGTEGTVLFARDRGMKPFMAIKARELGQLLPGLQGELDHDSYHSIAGFADLKDGEIVPPGYAAKVNVTHLPFAWVDIDGRNAPGGPVEQWQILSDVWRAVERGRIPAPSLYVNSGRGVWLFWQLATAAIATPAAIDTLVRINRAAVTFFARLGADSKSTNVNRWTRVPGSMNPAAGKRCAYLFAADDQQRPIVYTLAELAEAFDLPGDTEARISTFAAPPPTDRPNDRPKDPKKVAAGQKGWSKKHRNIAMALMHLQSLRGGFSKGTREMACHYLAFAMVRQRYPQHVIFGHLSAPDMFRPALPTDCIRKHIDSERRQRKGIPLSYQRIADDLLITPAEARAILDNVGIAFPHAFQNQLQPEAPDLTQTERIAQRRQRVAELKTADPSLTVREIVYLLTSEGVPGSSLFSIQGDLKALGINNARPVKREASLPLDLPDNSTPSPR